MKNPEVVEKVMELAQQHGYECVGCCEASDLTPTDAVRDMCAANTCKSYDKNWACPPGCGTIESWTEKFSGYSDCVVFETVMELEDEFDFETMMEAAEAHKDRLQPLVQDVRAIVPDCVPLSAGACDVCPQCTYPDAPCRFPDKQFVAMEAAGLVVSRVCTSANIPYNHGSDHICYVGCIVF